MGLLPTAEFHDFGCRLNKFATDPLLQLVNADKELRMVYDMIRLR